MRIMDWKDNLNLKRWIFEKQSAILPTGPVERSITYQAPFTKRNREQDYAMVWAVLDEQKEDSHA
jgi:hypothetical protein